VPPTHVPSERATISVVAGRRVSPSFVQEYIQELTEVARMSRETVEVEVDVQRSGARSEDEEDSVLASVVWSVAVGGAGS